MGNGVSPWIAGSDESWVRWMESRREVRVLVLCDYVKCWG